MATYNYSYTGSLQAYTTPSDGSVTSINVSLKGAQGGNGGGGAGNSSSGANGGTISANIVVTPGQVYYLVVGGQGASGTTITDGFGHNAGTGGGGGGKSFITTTNSSVMDGSVLVVAGAGGGGGSSAQYNSFPTTGGSSGGWPNGGAGGGVISSNPGGGGGGDGYYGGFGASGGSVNPTGGTQSSGYAFGAGGPGVSGYYALGSGNFVGVGGGNFGGTGSNGYGGGTPALAGGGAGGSSFAAGSTTTISNSQGTNAGNGSITIDEVLLVALTTSDSEIITDSVQTSGPLKKISASDTETISDIPSLARNRVTSDTPIQVNTSSYKYLTQTLYDAQNQHAVRPYISCQVIDETLLANQQMYNTLSGVVGFSGDAVTAPDGSILAIGEDITGNLRFAKITDGTQISQWNQILNSTGGTVIAANGSWIQHNPNYNSNTYQGFHVNASIAVSEYIAGTYTIDIYYWFNDGTYFQVTRSRSLDGGTTFTSHNDIHTTNIPNTTLVPFQVSAGKPIFTPSLSGGTTSAAVFVVAGSAGPATNLSNSISFGYTSDGTTTGYAGVSWTQWTNTIPEYNINDWSLHSFDVEYVNGVYYIVFSGYHTILSSTNSALPLSTSTTTQGSFFGNYGLYLTKLMQLGDVNGQPIFTEANEILVFNSSSSTNINQVLYPSLNYDGNYLWLNYRLDKIASISESSMTTTSSAYYLSKSLDLKNFDYPITILDSSGSGIMSSPYSNGVNKYSFVGNQNGYYYFWGDGALWQFVQNNIAADISTDISSIQIQDQSGGATSLNLVIANANGQWAGPTPTGTNYQAIWKNGQANKNSKVYLQLGYYNALGVPETVPRNIFYIDDLTQNISSTQNNLVLTGRDWNKLLSITQTAFTYNFEGPDMYYEPFSNTTTTNWNQSAGTWVQVLPTNNSISTSIPGNVFAPYTTYTNSAAAGTNVPTYTTSLTASTLAILSGFSISHPEVILSTSVFIPTGMAASASIDFYPWYLNSTNYIKVSLVADGSNHITLSIPAKYNNSAIASPSTSGSLTTTGDWYPIYIRLYNYGQQIDVMLGQNSSFGNSSVAFQAYELNYSGPIGAAGGPYNIYANLPGQLATVAIGTSGTFGTDGGSHSPATIWTAFYNLKFMQNTYSQTIEELTNSLGTLAHIFNYVSEDDLVQGLYDTTQWNTNGGVSFPNRSLSLPSQGYALQNIQQYSDGQIEFDAKLTVPTVNENFGFDFVFRSTANSNLTNCYKLRIMNSQNNGGSYLVKASLYISYGSSVDYPLFSTIIPDKLPSVTYSGSNNLNIDLTNFNHYQIAFNKGWIYLFINGIEEFAWYENNATQPFTTGYWGFSTVNAGSLLENAFSSNQTLTVENITFPTFWNQVPTFALNPGDDLSSAITTNLQTVFGWNFSDLGGRMKLVVLRNTDSSSYSYGDGGANYLLHNTSNDSSDKEYYNSVMVVGEGVSYLATNNSSIGSNGALREEVIVDYKITTVADARTRALQELSNIAKYAIQPSPTLTLNVGSELFDVVNIQDESISNASGINGNYRVYIQSISVDNQTNHSITLGTGNITS